MRKQTPQNVPLITCCCFLLSMFFLLPFVHSQSTSNLPVDILHYEAIIEPDIIEKTIKGEVTICFKPKNGMFSELVLDCGDLVVDQVIWQKQSLHFQQQSHQLRIPWPGTGLKGRQKIRISYHGQPQQGVRFFPDAHQMYTVFSTSHWMPCQSAPADRASFDLQLLLPPGLTAISSGKMRSPKKINDEKVLLRWHMKKSLPAYCFGFAIGPMEKFIEREYGVRFQYLSADYSEKELRAIFSESPTMLRFFERKAGVKYSGNSYSQMLPKGNISQEMHQFTVIRNSYGKQVLERPGDVNLGAHELAHQWWGNQVTCQDWTHFWLNEGMAVFMSSAYREYRFGRKAYQKDIAVYRDAYQKVIDKGLDKPLHFSDWDQPTPEDRTLVYYKGAYFLHLLREELGDRIFWKGIRRYTRKYFGKSVVSSNLQTIMEKVSRKDLSRLFADWVYRE